LKRSGLKSYSRRQRRLEERKPLIHERFGGESLTKKIVIKMKRGRTRRKEEKKKM